MIVQSHGRETSQGPGAGNFGLLLAVTFGGHAFGMAAFVGFAGLMLRISLSRLWVPYLALLVAGLVLAPFLYWARLARDRPKTSAFRFAIAMFAYGDVLTAALLFGAVWMDVLSPPVVLYDIVPLLLPFFGLMSVLVYVVVLQMLKDQKRLNAKWE